MMLAELPKLLRIFIVPKTLPLTGIGVESAMRTWRAIILEFKNMASTIIASRKDVKLFEKVKM
jgi:hypothetical protein